MRSRSTWKSRRERPAQDPLAGMVVTPTVAAPRPPAVGDTVNLGAQYGTCVVDGVEHGAYGMRMYALHATAAGRRTTRGDAFKMSEREVVRALHDAAQMDTEDRYRIFRGSVASAFAELGPSAWLPFLEWFDTVTLDDLPEAETQRAPGPLSTLYEIHERTLAGFSRPDDAMPMFTITATRRTVRGTDTIPDDALAAIREHIRSGPHTTPWGQYRHFVAHVIGFLCTTARAIVATIITHQQEWFRTRAPLDQYRLTRSADVMVRACGCSPGVIRALCAGIRVLRLNKDTIDIDECFTDATFERTRAVTVLTAAFRETGCSRVERLTLEHVRELRERATAIVNEGMPSHLVQPLSDHRFAQYLALAVAEAPRRAADTPACVAAWNREAAMLFSLVKRNRWNIIAAAAELRVPSARLRAQITRHTLDDALREEQLVRIARVYRSAVPNARSCDALQYSGIAAVAADLRENIANLENLTPLGRVQRMITEAMAWEEEPRMREITADDVRDALRAHAGDRIMAARTLVIRRSTLHRLIAQHDLWSLVAEK